MFQRVLVPLDGSPRSEQALSVATQFALQSGGTIVLLRVINLATEYWPAISGPYGLTESIVKDEQEMAEHYLRQVASRPMMSGIQTKCITRFGTVAPTILEVANEERADLIIICSHGYNGVTRLIMGSDADRVARHATIPTLIFHEPMSKKEEKAAVGSIAYPLRVLVPLDGSTHAEAALGPAVGLLTQYAAAGRMVALHLLRVIHSPAGLLQEENEKKQKAYQEELAEAKSYLQLLSQTLRTGLLAGELAQNAVAVTWSVTVGKDVAETIVHVAEGSEEVAGTGIFGGCDYIAISTHGRGAFQRWTMGCVTERALHLSKKPIMVVRPASTMEMLRAPVPALETNLPQHA